MRLRTVYLILFSFAAAAMAADRACAQAFVGTDWIRYRAGLGREGRNAGDIYPAGILPAPKGRVWVWPPPGDMPAEMAADDTWPVASPMFPAGGAWSLGATPRDQHNFGLAGPWTPAPGGANLSDRGVGAWPPVDVDPAVPGVIANDRIGDYFWANAEFNQQLARLANLDLRPGIPGNEGLDRLRQLPNMESFEGETQLGGRNFYNVVDQELRGNTTFARWSFGRRYPAGTAQGTLDVSGVSLQPNQRYAIYIRYPSSGAIINGVSRPNSDWVFVRVSWGDNPDDPRLSRIFMLNFGDGGGVWKRIQSVDREDRYFPYDGTHPLTVTLYTATFSTPNEIGIQTIVPADAVRLVPEAQRGDINAPAASAVFPPGADPRTDPRAVKLTYFGRDETMGPKPIFEPANIAQTTPVGNFIGIPYNPTLPPQDDAARPNYNPLIADPSSSIRSAVFYCFEDYINDRGQVPPLSIAGHRYGKLRWRFVSRTTPVRSTTIDDEPLPVPTAGGFTATAGFTAQADAAGNAQAHGGDPAAVPPVPATFHTAPTVAAPAAPTETAVWNTALVSRVTGGTYSVWVWIPARIPPTQYATRAHYVIDTDAGPLDVLLDQRNTDPTAPPLQQTNIGQWRRLATGVRFPGTVVNGVETVTANVRLGNDASLDDTTNGRLVVADAIQFVAESQSNNTVVAAPLISRVTWPSGRVRNVVYFATTDGHMWCLDALGPDQNAAGEPLMDANAYPVHTGSLTTAYWVYPSITNPERVDPATNPQGAIRDPRDDPNFNPDPENNRQGQGIDGDVEQVTVGGQQVWQVTEASRVPDLGAFVSSPLYVEIPSGAATQPIIVVGNNNGRIYGFSPYGRVVTAPDAANPTVGEPFANTFARHLNQAAGAPAETAGVPGTSRRVLTWPTLKRDKWLRANAPGWPNDVENQIRRYTDDPGKTSFTASLAAELQATGGTAWVVAGAGDGHVYAVTLQGLDFRERISNSNAGNASDGRARWQFPNDKSQLGEILATGALTNNGQANAQYIFTARDTNQIGFRVYAIDIPTTNVGGTPGVNWVFPHTTTPGGNPGAGDSPPVDSAFTAPAWLPTVTAAFNGGREVVYIANLTGQIYALDASIRNNNAPVLLWTDFDPINPANQIPSPSRSFGSTRASTVFLNALAPLRVFTTTTSRPGAPALIQPLDNGDIVAFNATNGQLMWRMPDGQIGGVPVTVPDPFNPANPPVGIPFATSWVWRGADVITVDKWMYQGDQGNKDLGESNGQMRAYADSILFGMNTTPNAPTPNPDAAMVDVRIVDVFNGLNDSPPGPWDNFLGGTPFTAPVISPYHAVVNGAGGGRKQNTQGEILVYEWGDDIKVAAWGAAYFDPTDPDCPPMLPQVTFLVTGTVSDRRGPFPAALDTGYVQQRDGGPDPDLVLNTADGDTCRVVPWVAKTLIRLGRPTPNNPQTPGSNYTISVIAETRSRTQTMQSPIPLQVGQRVLRVRADGTMAGSFDWDPALGINRAMEVPPAPGRVMKLAHPLAITTRGFDQTGTAMVGAGFLNILGWTNDAQPDNLVGDLSEILANGNRRYNLATGQVDVTNPIKNLVAPIGMINHGSSGVYTGIDDRSGSPTFGQRVPALFVADRSNMYKLNQPLQVRVERTDLRWGWNPNDPTQQYTGNVMNPLPWEVFPNTVPNVSPDYPNMDAARGAFRGNGMDMAVRAVSLPLPDRNVTAGRKRLSPLAIELQVAAPQYQPANVNTDFFDMRGLRNPDYMGGAAGNGLLAPLALGTGRDIANNAALVGNVAPSAGYVSQYYVYLDTNQNSRLEAVGSPGATQQTLTTGQEEVYRQLTVGATIPPDLKTRVEEETIDLGKMPHGSGYSPFLPFAPSGVGPYPSLPAGAQSISPWNAPNMPQFFAPFTVRNTGNVNLLNLRAAKVIGQGDAAVANVNFWSRLMSDQVEPGTGVGQIWGVPFFPAIANDGRGSIGVVTTLDHGHSDPNVRPFEVDYVARWNRPNFWPMPNPYVPAIAPDPNNPLFRMNWSQGVQPRPTAHKPRVGDPGPTTLSVPDVQHGDAFGYLAQVSGGSPQTGAAREIRPMVGLAVPLGTPAGTYSAPVHVFEDAMPDQWWNQNGGGWVDRYRQLTGQLPDLRFARDDDGLLNILQNGQPVESTANPTIRLKVTVREARLTNGPSVPIPQTPLNPNTYLQFTGDYPQVDVRINAPQFGANIQPAALMDQVSRSIHLFWAGNRLNNFAPLPPATSDDTPWYLNFSQLFQDQPTTSGLDWLFEPLTGNRESWWRRLPQNTQYPAQPYVANARSLFPSEAADLPMGRALPLVPGQISATTERHATPALTQDQINPQAPVWLFWQGGVYKTAGGPVPAGANQGFTLDSRTFYAPLANGAPNPPNGVPFAFLNDPNLPKFSPKPLVLTDRSNVFRGYLFWYGGTRGRTRLYYNRTNDMANPLSWSRDRQLDTPGGLQWQADPVPIHRRLVRSNGTVIDTVDVVYTGTLSYRGQAETLLTRYFIENDGDLRVEPLPRVVGEMMVREGTRQTWVTRDLAWVYRDAQNNLVDAATGRAPYTIFLLRGSNAPVLLTTGTPVFDRATGFIQWNSALGGKMIVDPQAGRVVFTGVAPNQTDRIMINYTPQSMRLNVTRNESHAINWDDNPAPTLPAGWMTDAGFTAKPHVNGPGSNSGPVSFIDRTQNPKSTPAYINSNQPLVMLPGQGSNPPTVSRLWLLYRKSNSNVTAPAAIYYKTMRLMVRLPRGVLLSNPGARRDATPNVAVANNRGPVEIDWARGRLYFTEVDEGNVVTVTFQAPGAAGALGPFTYRVAWGDEISTAVAPGDQTTSETVLPTDSTVNEGQISAFKDLFADRVWVFWSSTRAGTTDLYYMPISPQFYAMPAP